MITRKDLVEALRVLHETDCITKIVTRAKRIDVFFVSNKRDCLLVLPNPTPTNDTTNRNSKTITKPTTHIAKDTLTPTNS
jgi:hypothetical protein